jgi:hypothetical protein
MNCAKRKSALRQAAALLFKSKTSLLIEDLLRPAYDLATRSPGLPAYRLSFHPALMCDAFGSTPRFAAHVFRSYFGFMTYSLRRHLCFVTDAAGSALRFGDNLTDSRLSRDLCLRNERY